MPSDPVQKARIRLFLMNFEKEIFVHVAQLENDRGEPSPDKHKAAKNIIRDRLVQLAPIFLKNKYMMGEDFSMLDVVIAPLLWRLDHYGINLPKTAAGLLKYAERVFSRQSFIESLTASEKMMRR
jgi:RNA polymerase-associated protein